jgi:sulfur carrier protein
MSAHVMQVRLNGELREIPDGLTVAGLLAHLGVKAQRVAVEVNETVVTKDRYEGHRIGPGDTVEIVAFVGGG